MKRIVRSVLLCDGDEACSVDGATPVGGCRTGADRGIVMDADDQRETSSVIR